MYSSYGKRKTARSCPFTWFGPGTRLVSKARSFHSIARFLNVQAAAFPPARLRNLPQHFPIEQTPQRRSPSEQDPLRDRQGKHCHLQLGPRLCRNRYGMQVAIFERFEKGQSILRLRSERSQLPVLVGQFPDREKAVRGPLPLAGSHDRRAGSRA